MVHSEICAVPVERLEQERELLRSLPSLRPEIGVKPISRKVDKLSCIRFGSARYSVPCRLIGAQVLITAADATWRSSSRFTGEVVAEHPLVGPGETSIDDEHYGRPARTSHGRAPRPRTEAEKHFCALGPVAEAFLVGAAAAGVSKLPGELADILPSGRPRRHRAGRGAGAGGAVRRWRADDIRSILAAAGAAPLPRPAGDALVLTLPAVPTRSLERLRDRR